MRLAAGSVARRSRAGRPRGRRAGPGPGQGAVVGLRTQPSPTGARSRQLGREREGSGVVIDRDGLVLTIAYLLFEAEQWTCWCPASASCRRASLRPTRPAASASCSRDPARRRAGATRRSARVTSGDADDRQRGDGAIRASRAWSRGALHRQLGARSKAPSSPRRPHRSQRRRLFNAAGELVGIRLAGRHRHARPRPAAGPGNMFVPVDLLVPIYDELRHPGQLAAGPPAVAGLNCVEQAGQLRAVRVSPGSPAAAAGLLPGDQVSRIDGVAVDALAAFYARCGATGSPGARSCSKCAAATSRARSRCGPRTG